MIYKNRRKYVSKHVVGLGSFSFDLAVKTPRQSRVVYGSAVFVIYTNKDVCLSNIFDTKYQKHHVSV